MKIFSLFYEKCIHKSEESDIYENLQMSKIHYIAQVHPMKIKNEKI